MFRQAAPEAGTRLGAASAGFGLRLLAELTPAGRNVVLSPLGLQLALAVVQAGASGATRAALDEVLSVASGDAYAGLLRDLPDADPAVELALAQALWLDEGYRPGPGLLSAAEPLGVELGELRFADPDAVETVNRWGAARTRGMVERVLDGFEEDEHLVLAGAAYFNGAWTDPFDPANTAPATFTCGDGRAAEVAMMSAAGRFSYRETGEYRAVRLPYGDEGRFALVVLLGRDGLPRLDAATWGELRAGMQWRDGRVRLPRLVLDTRLDLGAALKGLGLGPAFVPGHDLDGLFQGGDPLKALGRVLQNARLEIDEAGTRAAAVTVVTAIAAAAALDPPTPFDFVADRPFLWAIEDAASATLLFLGVVNDPD
jgi:serpin B